MIVHRSRALLLEPFELILIFADIRDRHFPWVIYVSAQQATRVRVVTITLRVAGQRRALRRGWLRSSRLLIVILAPEITSGPGFLDDGFVCARDLCHSVGVETAERLDSGCSETTFRFCLQSDYLHVAVIVAKIVIYVLKSVLLVSQGPLISFLSPGCLLLLVHGVLCFGPG